MLTTILCFVIIALLIIAIVLLLFRKPKDNSIQNEQIAALQDQKMDNLNANVQNMSQINASQLANMNTQLNNVYESIGKIQSMSADVEQLRKVLANVKQRGVFAETQLKSILEQTIPGMYETNVKPNPRSDKIVEFAIKIPNAENGVTWLPIDSKFPLDRYTHLVEASEQNDFEAVEKSRKELITAIDREATTIKDKYIIEPFTTSFAVMYLASEGMYMEAVKDPGGLQEKLQARGIMIAGPSTILALLNSLAMGFSVIEINEKAGEIRKMLVGIKRQFKDFDEHLDRIERGLNDASKGLQNTRERSRKISDSLVKIEVADDEL